MAGKNEHGLTPQQEKFAQEVGSGKSLSEAYRAAYKVGKSKPETVNDSASKLMANPLITQRVAKIQADAADKAGLDASAILLELKKLAHSDIAGIMTPEGRVKLPHELDPQTRAAVSSFKIDEYGRIEYKFWPKNAAIDMAMKHLGLFDKDNKQKTDPFKALVDAVTGNVQGVAKDCEHDDE
jgi:phage terminase small subunit